MYPKLEINLTKLAENAQLLLSQCSENGIESCFLVTKVLAGDLQTVKRLAGLGFSHLADSRMENLIRFQSIPLPKVLLRLPMADEAEQVVHFADMSLNSELSTIRELSYAALTMHKMHDIILMFDLGDLREGIYFTDDYLPIVQAIRTLPGIRLVGIGTNLTCYGGVIPDAANLNRLVEIKRRIESETGQLIKIVSGGNSSMVHLFGQDVIPKEINNLRIGEALFLGRETAYGRPIIGLHQDAFTLQAELIEAKEKPSYPLGNIGMNSFGKKPDLLDQGPMRRGILAIGKQDVEPGDLIPRDERISIIGASSDHLIVDLGRSDFRCPDILYFDVNYPGLLRIMTSPYVQKIHRK